MCQVGERIVGVEPTLPVWQTDALPMCYTRIKNVFLFSAGWRRFAKFLGFPRNFNSVRSYVVHQTQWSKNTRLLQINETAYKQYIYFIVGPVRIELTKFPSCKDGGLNLLAYGPK